MEILFPDQQISHYSIKVELDNSYSVLNTFKYFKEGQLTVTGNFKNKRTIISSAEGQPLIQTPKLRINYINMNSYDSNNEIVSSYEDQGIIRLFKLNDQNHYESKRGETMRKIVTADNTMCCLFYYDLELSQVLKKIKEEYARKSSGGDDFFSKCSHLRVLQQNSLDGIDCYYHMMLINFHRSEDCVFFQQMFNGFKLNSTYVKTGVINEIIFSTTLFKERQLPGNNEKSIPYLLSDPFITTTTTTHSTVNNDDTNDTKKILELPICPVCLERMDSAVTGLITIQCQHTFHCNCLDRCTNSKCPVCRYSFNNNDLRAKCTECDSKTNLWCCLICGHIGCSRYVGKHAIDHYKLTGHCFSIDMRTSRVWDYADDKYVHRIVQNQEDGKLVEVSAISGAGVSGGNNNNNNNDGNCNMDDDGSNSRGITNNTHYCKNKSGSSSGGDITKSNSDDLEYIQLLLSQLESQEMFYSRKISDMERKNEIVSKKLESAMKQSEKIKKLTEQYELEKAASENIKLKMKSVTATLKDLECSSKKSQMENEELKKTLADLMFHLEAKSTIEGAENNGEIKEGSIIIKETQPVSELFCKNQKKKKKKRKK